MKTYGIAAVLGLGLLTAASPAQVTAGTRSADDHSAQDAIATKITAAESALERQDFHQAADLLKALASEQPKDAHVLYDLGYANEHLGEDAAASDAYTRAIAADAAMSEPRVALGLLDARAGRSNKAHGELTAAASIATASPAIRGRALRALAQMDAQNNPADAGDELLSAIRLTGEQPGDTELSARLAEHSGDAGGAEQAYRKALTVNPGNLDAAVGLAHVLKEEGKLADAEGELTTAMKASDANAEDPRLVAQLASVYVAEGKDSEAIPLVESLRSKNPAVAKDPTLNAMLARMYAMSGRTADAETLYKTLVASSPEDPSLLDALGGVLVKEDKADEAVAVLRKAVGMREAFHDDTAWGEATSHLAFAASQAKQPELCLQALAARATVLPNSPASLFLGATAHDSLHQRKEAIAGYKAFLAVAGGKFPDEEFEARHRLIALEHEQR